MSSACTTCTRETAVGMSFGQWIGRRLVRWRLCVECWVKEERANAA